MAIEQACLAGTILIPKRLACAQHTEQGVIEALRTLDVI
jgi:hypothetical protein